MILASQMIPARVLGPDRESTTKNAKSTRVKSTGGNENHSPSTGHRENSTDSTWDRESPSPPAGEARWGCEGVFFFDPADPIYADHFPGKPVVPGSMIVRGFMLAAQKDGRIAAARLVRDFRFRKFVSPGKYRYRIEKSGTDLKCFLFDGDSVVATGILEP